MKRGITDMQEFSTTKTSDNPEKKKIRRRVANPLKALMENVLFLFDGFRFLSLLWHESP